MMTNNGYNLVGKPLHLHGGVLYEKRHLQCSSKAILLSSFDDATRPVPESWQLKKQPRSCITKGLTIHLIVPFIDKMLHITTVANGGRKGDALGGCRRWGPFETPVYALAAALP